MDRRASPDPLLSGIVEHAPFAIAVFDATPDFPCVLHNRPFLDVTGGDAGERGAAVGLPLRAVFPASAAEVIAAGFRRALETGEPRSIPEFPGVVAPGAVPRSFNLSLLPLSSAGRVAWLLVTAVEVTDLVRARQAAEAERGRFAFLAEASAILASSLDYEDTLQRAAHLAVPTFADLCTVDVRQLDGTLRRVALAHVDAAKEAELRAVAAAYPPGWEEHHPVGQVVRSGKRIVMSDLPREIVAGIQRGEPHLALSRATDPRSYLILPLLARGEVLGAIGFVYTVSGRRYAAADVSLGEELARRAAHAIDNARLHARAQRALARLEALADASQAFAAARLDVQAVLHAVTARVVELLGDSCAIRLVDADGWLVPAAVQHRNPEAGAFLSDLIGSVRQPATAGLNGTVIASGEPLFLGAAERAGEAVLEDFRPYVERFGLASLAILPLRSAERVLGTVAVSRDAPGAPYSPADQALLQALVDRAALALDNAQLFAAERLARAEAEAAVRARDEFLSIAAHELKTPLAGLKVTAQVLAQAQTQGRLDAERLERYVARIGVATDRLARLVDDLLDVSRLRTGRTPLRLAEVDLPALIRLAVESVPLPQPGPRVELRAAELPGPLRADADRLAQVFTNLLENAVKYSPRGGTITVRLAPEGDGVLVSVADQGIGLPQGAEETIFEPFGRAPNAAAHGIPGMGLGLYISRRIAEAHGGRLRAEGGGEGKGTTFRLWLPLHAGAGEGEEGDGG